MSVKTGRKPTFTEALIPMILLFIIIIVSVVLLKTEAHIPLFFVCIFVALFAKYLGYTWAEIEETMIEGLKLGLLPSIIMLLTGMVIGGWIAGGIVPYIISLGIG